MLLTGAILTHLIPAGKFDRSGKQVVAGTYHQIGKINGIRAIVSPTAPSGTDMPARAAGVVALFKAIPAGMVQSSALIFMVMFVGGTFGVLRATGSIDAGVDRLVQLSSGNIYLLGCGLFLLLACGCTFLGFSSEYVALIPIVLELGRKLRLPALFAPGIVATADFIGYNASVTNPVALGVAQPLAGVGVFSGLAPRLIIFVLMLAMSIAYLVIYLRRQPRVEHVQEASRLTSRQVRVLVTLVVGGGCLIAGTAVWSWHTNDLAPAFVALATLLALAGGLQPGAAADAFLDGMKGMLLPTFLIGLAGGIGVLLQASQVLDTVVQAIGVILSQHAPGVVAVGLMIAEMGFGILMPSVSAKAAVSVPIMAPIAHLAGVSGQISVTALLLGSGVTNMITPTNPLLLAFLAAAKVDFVEWLRFIMPLFLGSCLIGFLALYAMASMGI